MKRVEVEVEHYFQKRFMGRKRLLPNEGMVVIGQTKECDLRLLGEGVSNIHASIEFRDGQWWLSDLGSEKGTWIRKKAIVSEMIHNQTLVNIGLHELKVIPKAVESHLFTENTNDTDGSKKALIGVPKHYHQVIVKKNTFVVGSYLLDPKEDFIFDLVDKKQILKAPTSKEWTISEYGDVRIQQRLASTAVIEETHLEKVSAFWDPNLKGPAIVSLALLAFLFLLVSFHPGKDKTELTELKPDTSNKYTKMIFDANAVRKKREQAKQVRNSITSKSSEMSAPTKDKQIKVAQNQPSSPTKVVNQIKAAGLSQLIGKISKRAAINAKFIQGVGATPDSGKATGRSLATLGDVTSKAKGSSQTYKVTGVSTDGKAGGSTTYQQVGGLALGNVGTATVGVLEEETEVEGGLDKDLIARVIEKNLGQIRYCYERQLSANPDLYGKVLVKFTIGGNGAVEAQNIGLTTLKSAMVEGCILRRVSGWSFPKPKGGTQVLVTYPFLFKSTN